METYMGFWVGPNNGKNFFLMQILTAKQDKISGIIEDRFGESVFDGKLTKTLVEFSKYMLDAEKGVINQAIFYRGKKEDMGKIYLGKYTDVRIKNPDCRENMFVIEPYDPSIIQFLKKHIPCLKI
ncbi:MAG: hypothetical protein WC475_02430 [Candidatus Paceibacterota bacterium]